MSIDVHVHNCAHEYRSACAWTHVWRHAHRHVYIKLQKAYVYKCVQKCVQKCAQRAEVLDTKLNSALHMLLWNTKQSWAMWRMKCGVLYAVRCIYRALYMVRCTDRAM